MAVQGGSRQHRLGAASVGWGVQEGSERGRCKRRQEVEACCGPRHSHGSGRGRQGGHKWGLWSGAQRPPAAPAWQRRLITRAAGRRRQPRQTQRRTRGPAPAPPAGGRRSQAPPAARRRRASEQRGVGRVGRWAHGNCRLPTSTQHRAGGSHASRRERRHMHQVGGRERRRKKAARGQHAGRRPGVGSAPAGRQAWKRQTRARPGA